MPKRLNKILSILISILLLLEQSAFAAGGAIDLSSSFSKLASGISSSLSSSGTNAVFRPIHLRYLEYLPKDNSFKLLLDKGSIDPSLQTMPPKVAGESTSSPTNPLAQTNQDLTSTTQDLMKYFYIGLTLPNDAFWVNLRPNSPDNTIDSLLAQTDIGRILLEADVELKKDTASYTNPNTPIGKEYWNKLYKKASELFGTDQITIPTLTRPWIVPGEIIIRETTDSAYIYKATLKVMLEEDYFKAQSTSLRTPAGGEAISKQGLLRFARNDKRGVVGNDENSIYQFNDPRLKELNSYSTKLIKELIIPKLTKEVNSSRRYASLRQVYYSLIMAQWFKARYRSQRTEHREQSIASSLRVSAQHERSNLDSNVVNPIDSKNLFNLTSKTLRNKQDRRVLFRSEGLRLCLMR
ncbi:MAG: hypothetical protein HZC15_06510 [Candidatus Omnitrophica bacterium]|nr:hypothetical protein [Candidatus Omnitrophota bacterium]